MTFLKEIEEAGATIVATKTYTNEEVNFAQALSKIDENNYLNRFAVEPTSFSALGYDAIKLISSLRLENPETKTILDELNKVRDFHCVTGDIDFSNGRDPVKSAVLLRLQKGKLSIEQKIAATK